MLIVLAVAALLLVLGLVEHVLHCRRLNAIKLRILVNGTRGKTSVTRLIAGVLREQGMVTWAKTTGSDARYILPDGSTCDYRGRRPANIIEQLPFIRLAARGNADAVVIECMALLPENQQLMADKLVCPTHVVLTNAFVDHVDEIGSTARETARVLALSVPAGAVTITGDQRFVPHVSHMVKPDENADLSFKAGFGYPVHDDNLRLVLALAQVLGIPEDTAVRGMLAAAPDMGMEGPFQVGACHVVNAFAANDPDSFRAALWDALARGDAVHLLFNHRADRGYRLDAFVPVLREAAGSIASLGVIGEDKQHAARRLSVKTGLAALVVEDAYKWLHSRRDEEQTVLCFGNIKGEAYALIEKLMERRGQDG